MLTVIVTQEVQSNGLQFRQWAACVAEARIWPSIIMEDQSDIQKLMLVPCITRSCSKHSLSNTGVKCDLNWGEACFKIFNTHICNSERTVSHLWPAYHRLSNFHPVTPVLYSQCYYNISMTMQQFKSQYISERSWGEKESIYFLCLLLCSLGDLGQPEEWHWTVSSMDGVWVFLT